MVYRDVTFSIRLLRLALGAFFIVIGIAGLFPNIQESIFSLSFSYTWLEVLFGLLEIVCGVLMLIGFFTFRYPQPVFWGGLIALILWGIRVVLTKFAWNFFMRGSTISIPDFFNWLIELIAEIIIGISLFAIMSRNN
jgi:hypothetical protein